VWEFFADYHMHTRYSDGRATVAEMAGAARDRGLTQAGITDHGPGGIGIGVKNAGVYQRIREEVRGLNREYADLALLVGAEANVTSLAGDIDLPRDVYRKLDLLIIGLHPYVVPETLGDGLVLIANNRLTRLAPSLKERARNDNTKALVAAMDRHRPEIISHPGLDMPVDVPEVAKACARWDVAFEINCGHQFPDLDDVIAAAGEGADFVVNSDAHHPASVGDLAYGAEILEQAGIGAERVWNAREEKEARPEKAKDRLHLRGERPWKGKEPCTW
jgi:putative hydrolase